MSSTSIYQPFTKAAAPFSIGLAPVNKESFLHIDDQYDRYISEKRKRYATEFDRVFMAENDTLAGQLEAADFVDQALANCGRSSIPAVDEALARTAPLAAAALRVQDDLVLMRRDDRGWRLIAASLCFPSSWSLQEKFGLPMEQVHEPVPGMAGKMMDRVNRIFDNLRPDNPVWRENWTLEGDSNLNHERGLQTRSPNYKRDKLQGKLWLRTEYQTLHKFPISGDILFTIKIMARALSDIVDQPNGATVLAGLYHQYQAMSEAERSYKGINEGAEKLLAWLHDKGKVGGNSINGA